MNTITITPENIQDNPWIWDFFKSQTQRTLFWPSNTTFYFGNQTFEFSQPVFARKRTNEARGYAFEMVSSQNIGQGVFGQLSKISKTISLDQLNHYSVKDKNRVVKIQNPYQAIEEYDVGKYATHLHLKYPTKGYLVMSKMPGVTLQDFMANHSLTRQETMELTRTLLHRFKEQLVDKHIQHHDLHGRNIMVDVHHENGLKKFEINFIDFGLAVYAPKINLNYYNNDLKWGLIQLIVFLWNSQEGIPLNIHTLIDFTHPTVNQVFEQIDNIFLSPVPHIQIQLDLYSKYLELLSRTYPDFAQKLKLSMKQAISESTPQDITPIKNLIKSSREQFLSGQGVEPMLPCLVLDANPDRQKIFNHIFQNLKHLADKGQELSKQNFKLEGASLVNAANALWEKTYEATYLNQEEQMKAFSECFRYCKEQMNKHHNVIGAHRNYNYMISEIGIILSSLIVLYPIIAGIHYLVTGRMSFFGQTKSSAAAEAIHNDFNQLITISQTQ